MVNGNAEEFPLKNGSIYIGLLSDTPLESQALLNWPQNERIVTGTEVLNLYYFIIVSIRSA